MQMNAAAKCYAQRYADVKAAYCPQTQDHWDFDGCEARLHVVRVVRVELDAPGDHADGMRLA